MPDAIAHYNLLERLGSGGLGEVYRARDTRVGRTVALKVLRRELFPTPEGRDAFKAAVRAAGSVSHPNIATLFDEGEHDGRWYLAYEFASGITLRQEMGGRPVHPRRALELANQIADALAEAHARNMVHGDLRPDNIIVTDKGSAKILDFGLASWTRGGIARAAAAASPDALGSDPCHVAAYLSPEQAIGSRIDARSDLFSLGIMLYEMLTGRSPFSGPSPDVTLMNVIRITPPPPSEVNPVLPPDIDPLISRLLAKDLESRYQSAASLAAELRGIAAVLDVRSGDSGHTELIPFDDETRARRVWIPVLVLLAIVAAVWWLGFR
jgi:serine/threonine protein kinase